MIAMSPRISTKPSTASSAPAPAEVDPGCHEAHARGEHDQDRMQNEAELRHAEIELALEGRERHEEAAHGRRSPPRRLPRRLARLRLPAQEEQCPASA
jgi:hypothetical protein